jgi:hypothetical protein
MSLTPDPIVSWALGIVGSNASKATAVMAMRIMPTDVASLSGVGALYDCAALLGGNGHRLDIDMRAVLLSV